MTKLLQNGTAPHNLRLGTNLFEIANLPDLSIEYRLVEVQGLPRNEHYDKNINKLVQTVAYELRQPVALVPRDDRHFLALPENAPAPRSEIALVPHVASLTPQDRSHLLDLTRLDEAALPIAIKFLQFSFRSPLRTNRDLWSSSPSCFFSKHPINSGDKWATVDMYPGFVWAVVAGGDDRLYLSVDATFRYLDRRWFSAYLNGRQADSFRGRHMLYHNGHDWYVVEFQGLTGASIGEQRFLIEGENRIVDVFSYVNERWGRSGSRWISELDPASPAILYRYPGRDRDWHGALALCKLIPFTDEPEVSALHRRSILDPAPRLEHAVRTIERYFQNARLGSEPIQVLTAPREVERRVFRVPDQRFGHDRVLTVRRTEGSSLPAGVTDFVSLDRLGSQRLRLLLDPSAGPLDTTTFDVQHLFLPLSSPRAINEDFAQKFKETMGKVSGQNDYALRITYYDDREATSLYQQMQVIKRAVASCGVPRGYALLVLPERAKRDLHHRIKRALWPDLQIKCALAKKIRGFYESVPGEARFRPAPDRSWKLDSYVRNCALGMMVVNRKWPWALAGSLHHDVHIGIDVLNGMAGLSFVYSSGQQIFLHDHPGTQRERLTKRQAREIVGTYVRQHLLELGLRPRSIVIHRDGRTFSSELAGLHAAVRDLQTEGILPLDVRLCVVDIRKTSSNHLRLFEQDNSGKVRNPSVGSYLVLGPREGIVCTTGWPFRFPGTARPLSIVIADGNLDIEQVLEDIFALSQLSFTAPDRCIRLPLTIQLIDDFLEAIASQADEEAVLYDDEVPDDSEEASSSVAIPVSAAVHPVTSNSVR